MEKRMHRPILTAVLSVVMCMVAALAAFVFGRVDPSAAQAEQDRPLAVYMINDGSVTNAAGYTLTPATATAPITYRYRSAADGWAAAVSAVADSTSTSDHVRVVLVENWTAAGETSSFGDAENAFSHGRINVPGGVNILLDLNGKTIDRGLIESEPTDEYGNVINVLGKLEIADGVGGGAITGGCSLGNGGGITVEGMLVLSGGSISNNAALGNGGGVYADGGAVVVDGGEIAQNFSVGAGGGIYAEQSNVEIAGGEIRNNGVMYIDDGNSDITDKQGGGIYLSASELTMNGGTISENLVSADAGRALGGGISAHASSLTLTGGTVGQNTAVSEGADIRGGGIYAAAQSSVALGGNVSVNANSCTANSGDAVMYGGGLYAESSTVVMSERASISNNTLVNGENAIGENGAGGGVAVSSGIFTLSGGAISGNSAHRSSAVELLGSGTTLRLIGGTVSGNQAAEGGAVQWANGARVQLEGDPVVKDNTVAGGDPANVIVIAGMTVTGAISGGADIRFTAETGVVLATGFEDHNSQAVVGALGEYTIAQNPARYFAADNGKHVALGADGVAVVDSEVTFSYAYGVSGTALTPVTAAYGVDGIVYKEGYTFNYEINGTSGEAISDAGIHTLEATVGSVPVCYTVVINPADASSAAIEIEKESYDYEQGAAIEPSVTSVTLDGAAIGADDYDIEYSSNTAVGTATVKVTFKNNYTGYAVKSFTIVNRGLGEVVQVTWEYNTAAAPSEWTQDSVYWVTLDAERGFTFMPGDGFEGVDQGKRIRALLTTNDGNHTEYIYSYATAASNQTLEFNNGGSDPVLFVNAGTYSVTLSEGGNYPLAGNVANTTVSGLTIDPMALELKSGDYAEYEDEAGNRLWQLVFESGDPNAPVTVSRLMDGSDIGYIVYENGQYLPKVGAGDDSYARYRGNTALGLTLNGDYTVNGHSLEYWLGHVAAADIAYSNVGLDGVAQYRENAVTTTATVNFGENYVLADGGHALVLTKSWYVVTIENMLRSFNGTSASNINVMYGRKYPSLNSMRPEYGDLVYWTLSGNGITPVVFAVRFVPDPADQSPNNMRVTEQFYTASVDADGNYTLGDEVDSVTFGSFLERLDAGAYALDSYVPEYRVPDGTVTLPQWWTSVTTGDAVLNDGRTVFAAVRQNFTVTVEPYDIGSAGFTFDVLPQVYSGKAVMPGAEDITVTYTGEAFDDAILLALGKDFTVSFNNNTDATPTAVVTFTGTGNFTGSTTANFVIMPADNSWVVTPNIVRWTYGNFDKSVNAIDAQPRFLARPEDMWFKITTDLAGRTAYEGLDKLRIGADGTVSDEVADIFNGMVAGVRYYLFAYVESTDNYNALESGATGMAFQVFRAVNYWETRPTIKSWTEGEFSAKENLPLVEAHYGNGDVIVTVTDGNDNVYYDSTTGLNELGKLAPGRYSLTARVAGTSNYSELADYTFVFEVFKAPGLPWWGVLLIVLGVLAVVAIVILTLWKLGVFTLLTDKVVIAIRSRASIDATLASVRAAKRAEEARKLIAEAKRKEAAAARAEAKRAEKDLPEEERAAALEAKAQQAEDRLEKMRARMEAMQKRAERMREQARKLAEAEAMDAAAESAIEVEVESPATPAEQPKAEEPEVKAEEPAAEAAATETPDTPTEE